MSTSLASQLSQLKLQQKDQISLPSRSKLSFLFNIKQAASIDDQTIFFLCQSGLEELKSITSPLFHSYLQEFEKDIFNSKSLEFHRGTEPSKEVLKTLDERIEHLLKLLTPYFLLPCVHKVLEFLIRVYEVQVYQKESILLAFMPYFETSFYTRLIQTLNLEKDEHFHFLNDFAAKGVSVNKETIVRAIMKSKGLLFQRLSIYGLQVIEEFDVKGLPLPASFVHIKFLGSILAEVVIESQKQKDSEATILTILPFISKGLTIELKNQEHNAVIQELRIASLLAISQIACRRSLSQDYSQAFIQQVLNSLGKSTLLKEQQQNFLKQGIVTILVIFQFQRISALEESQAKILLNIKNVNYSEFANSYDVSFLCKLLASSMVQSNEEELCHLMQAQFFKGEPLPTKCYFRMIEQVSYLYLTGKQPLKHCQRIFECFKAHQEKHLASEYQDILNQCLTVLLKQLDSNSKEKLVEFISNTNTGQLISKYGDKEYSLLSALTSPQKIVRHNALKTISNKNFKVSHSDRELIKLSVLQSLLSSQDDTTTKLCLQALNHFVDKDTIQNLEFEQLEQFINTLACTTNFNDESLKLASDLALTLKVEGEQKINQTLLRISVMQFNHENMKNTPGKSKKVSEELKEVIGQILHDKEQTLKLILTAFQDTKSYFKFDQEFETLVQQFIQHIKKQSSEQGQQYLENILQIQVKLSNFKKKERSQFLYLQANQLENYAQFPVNQSQIIENLFVLGYEQVRVDPSFSIQKLTSIIYDKAMSSNIKRLVEFYIERALQGSNEKFVLIALTCLAQIINLKSLTPSILTIMVVILLRKPSKVIRERAFMFFEEVVKHFKEEKESLNVFNLELQNPPSVTKKKKKQPEFTPIKSTSLIKFLKELIASKHEITKDQNYLSFALNKSETFKEKIMDQTIKSFIDLPTIQVKINLLKSLSQCDSFSLMFQIALKDQLEKEYDTFSKLQLIDQDTKLYLAVIGELILKMSLTAGEYLSQFVPSTVFNYLKFALSFFETKRIDSIDISEAVKSIFTQSLLLKETFEGVNEQARKELLKLYIKTQAFLPQKRIRDQIFEQFVLATQENSLIKQGEFNSLITHCLSHTQETLTLQQLEITLEVLQSLDFSTFDAVSQHAAKLVQLLGYMCSNNEDQIYYYSIYLTVLILSNILEVNASSSDFTAQTMDNLFDILKQQYHYLQKIFAQQQKEVEEKTSDPFKQFIMEIDTLQESRIDSSNLSFEFQSFTIFQNLFHLLANMEISVSQSQNRSEIILSLLAKDIQTQCSKSLSSYEMEHLIKLFRIYQGLIHKQVIIWKQGGWNENFRDLLAQYLELYLMLLSRGQCSFGDLMSTINDSSYVSFILLILVLKSTESISVKEDLQLDSVELQIFKQIIFSSSKKGSQVILELLSEFMHQVGAIQLNESDNIGHKFGTLIQDNKERKETTQWITQRIQDEGGQQWDRKIRRFKYISIYFLDELLNKNTTLHRELSRINEEASLPIFEDLYLSIALCLEQFKACLAQKQFKDSSAKKSLKRLQKRAQSLMASYNNIISYSTQVRIVLNIQQNDVLQLKITSIQYLLQKVPQFQLSLSNDQQENLSTIFLPLLEKLISILQKLLKSKKLEQDDQTYIQTIFILLSQSVCLKMKKDLVNSEVEIVFKYLEAAEKKNMSFVLYSQILMSMMQLFEVFQADLLEHLTEALQYLQRALEICCLSMKQEDAINHAFTETVIKVTSSVIFFFAKFMNVSQLEQILGSTLQLGTGQLKPKVIEIYSSIIKEGNKTIGFNLLFRSIINLFASVIMEKGLGGDLQNLSEMSILFLEGLIVPMVKRMKKDFCTENFMKVSKFFLKLFKLPEMYYTKHNIDLKDISELESRMVEAFAQFVVKLNEEQLRPIIVKLMKWAFKKVSSPANFPYKLHRQIIFFKLTSGVTDLLKEFFVPLLPIYIDNQFQITDLLLEILCEKEKESKKRKFNEVDGYQVLTQSGHNLKELLIVLCGHIKRTFESDQSSFIQSDVFERFISPTSKMLLVTQLHSAYLPFIEEAYLEMVFEMVERISNDDAWKRLNYQVLLHSRNTNWQVRLASFKVIEHLFNRVGERYLMLLNDVLPFLAEGLEDEKQEVEMVVKSIIRRVEQLTGDSIQAYLR